MIKFASAVSEHPSIYKAIGECAAELRRQLGGTLPELCILTVNKGYGSSGGIGHAPAVALEHVTRDLQGPTPALIGGVFAGLYGNGRLIEHRKGAVSLFAACFDGAACCTPFYVRTPSLPALRGDQWRALLGGQLARQGNERAASSSGVHAPISTHTSSGSSTGGAGIGSGGPARSDDMVTASTSDRSGSDGLPRSKQRPSCILLSTPHFTEVETLLSRLSSAVPGLQVLGGVSEPDAWAEAGEHHHGAVFLGDQVHSTGAVGCFLQGDLCVQPLLQTSSRNVSPVCTITEAAGSAIVELDGRPVQDVFEQLLHDASTGRYRHSDLMLGLDEGGGGGFVARLMSVAISTRGPVVVVAASQVPVGSKVVLQVRDYDLQAEQLRLRLEAAAEKLPLDLITPSLPSRIGLLAFSCTSVPRSETDALNELLPQVALGGARVQGEFGSARQGGAARLHSFASSVALLRPAGP